MRSSSELGLTIASPLSRFNSSEPTSGKTPAAGAADHSRAVRSALPVTTVSSRPKATDVAGPRCPRRTANVRPVPGRQSRAVPSSLAVPTRRPSREKSTSFTDAV